MKNADNKLYMQVVDSINKQMIMHAPVRICRAQMRP